MGDAGPQTPDPLAQQDSRISNSQPLAEEATPLREVKVLVTGFGPFKSFLINPSWLIASALPDELYPHTTTTQKSAPYKITLITHPSQLRVSYATVSSTLPALISQHSPDLILHIGMAGGRDCYSLETRAHRNHYRIKDVDDCDGREFEQGWEKEGVPDVLYTGWDERDVLQRWEEGVDHALAERGFLGQSHLDDALSHPVTKSGRRRPSLSSRRKPRGESGSFGAKDVSVAKADEHRKKSCVKLSTDAGRFLCEFALFASLAQRWIDARDDAQGAGTPTPAQTGLLTGSATTSSDVEADGKCLAQERLGRVAFLHVPGWTGVEDVNRGGMVAEEAIRALVESWEEGYRRGGRKVEEEHGMYTQQHSEEKGRGVMSWRA